MTAVKRAGLVTLGLMLVAVPHFAAAAVVVAEPTGDADPAFLAELRASLETVAAEAPAELNAELRSSAANNDAGLELVVELVPSDGSTPIRETRTVTTASALSQARAMGRAAIRSLVAPIKEETAPPIVVAQERPVAAPPQPPLPEKYSRRKALLLSFIPGLMVTAVGGGLSTLSVADPAFGIPGIAIATIGLSLGPSLGYFWIGRVPHALVMAGVRLAAIGIGIAFMVMYVHTFVWGDEDIEARSTPGYLVTSILGFTTAIVAALVDAALVGRAADRANAEWREKNKPTVQVTPIAWADGNGQRTVGLALLGAF